MSDNIVALTNKKKNEIEFEMEVEGLTVNPSSIRFIIETSDMDYAFKCSKKKGKVYTVIVPPLPQLEKTLYPFRIEVVIDGYHFTPMEGQVNVTGSFDVYTTDAKNVTVAPPTKKAAVKKVTPKKEEKDIAGLAKKVVGKKAEDKPATKKAASPKKETAVKSKTKGPIKQSDILKAGKKAETKKPAKKAAPVKEEIAATLDVANIEADKLVKDAIQNLREAKTNIPDTPKVETKPFFKKVTSKKEKVVKEETVVVPERSKKDQDVHAILEGATAEKPKPSEPVVAFKKGKRVKN